MSANTIEKLEAYKKKHNLSDSAVAEKLSQKKVKVYPIYLYRWRKAGKIIGIYKGFIEDFLLREKDNGRF